MRRSVFSVTVTAVAVTCLLGVAGCDKTDAGASGTSAPASQAAVSNPTDTTSTSATSSVPDGYQYVTASVSGFQLAIPDGWSMVDPSKVTSDPKVQEAMQQVASSLGMTVDQIIGAGYDFVAVSSTGIPNVNVVKPQTGALTSDTVDQTMSQIQTAYNATDMAKRQVTTAVGNAYVVSYTAVVSGTTVYQDQVYQQVSSSQVAIITVTGKDAAEAESLANVIVDTISKV